MADLGTGPHVAIVGGGFAGTLMALDLMRHDGPTVTLIERRPAAGRGLAYAAAQPDHRLNLRASRMSALPDDPEHFLRWLRTRGGTPSASDFVPRLVFGDYVAELLAETVASCGGRLHVVTGEAIDIAPTGTRSHVTLADGRKIVADAIVLAMGNPPPGAVPTIARDLPADLSVADPWAVDIADGLGANDTVLIVGTGLTMVDMALCLETHGFEGRIVALSRRGLLPRGHLETPPAPAATIERPRGSVSTLLHSLRARASQVGWHRMIDEVRVHTRDIWTAASPTERERFLRHLRPWWDIHRHRIAPVIAERIAAMRADGRLQVVAGKLVDVERSDGRLTVRYRERGEPATTTLVVRRIVNCTGPQCDPARAADPLLRTLHARGSIRPDRFALGLDVTGASQVIERDGRTNPTMFALGPLTRGAFWEIIAVPDIRQQTRAVAEHIVQAWSPVI